MTRQYARVLSVDSVPLGSDLASDVTAGDTVLWIEDTSDFSEDGGEIFLGGELVSYETVDPEEFTLTLTEPAPASLVIDEDDTFVAIADENGLVVRELMASLDVDDFTADEAADSIIAEIDFALIPHLPEGIRSEEEQELVEIEWDEDGTVRILNIVREKPLLTAEYIDTTTITPDLLPSDGHAPGNSPTPTVRSGIGSLFISWTPISNADPVGYRVLIGTAPDTGDVAATTTGSTLNLNTLADGTPLAYGTTYYVSVIAFDEDGDAPQSPEVTGTIMRVGAPDLDEDVSQSIENAATAAAAAQSAATAAESIANAAAAAAADAVDDAEAAAQAAADAHDLAQAAQTIANDTATDLDVVEGRVTTAEGEISSVDARVTTAEGTVSSLNSRVSGVESDVSLVESRVTTAEGTLTTVEGRVDTAEASISSHSGRLDDVEDDIVNITTVQLPGKSKVTYATSAPGSTPNTAGDLWFRTSGSEIIEQYRGNGGTSWTSMTLTDSVITNLNAGTITAGTLAAARIAAGSIDTSKISTAGLDAATIKFGTMSGDRIEAGTLIIGHVNGLEDRTSLVDTWRYIGRLSENLLPNPSFDSNVTGWLALNASSAIAYSTTQASDGAGSLRLTRVGSSGPAEFRSNPTDMMPVDPNTPYTVAASAYSTVARPIAVTVEWCGADGSYLQTSPVALYWAGTEGQWTRREGSITSHANAAYARLRFRVNPVEVGEYHYFDEVVFGTGDAEEGSTTFIDGGKIATNTITADQISSNYIYTGTLLANQIRGGSIESDVLLSGAIRTAETGARVEMNADGIVLYNASDQPTTVLGSDGGATFKGEVETDSITIHGGLAMRGEDNEISRSSKVTLQAGVTRSSAQPTVVASWQTIPLTGRDFSGRTIDSMNYYGGKWYVAHHGPSGGTRVDRFSTTGVFEQNVAGFSGTGRHVAWVDSSNYVRVGDSYSDGTYNVTVASNGEYLGGFRIPSVVPPAVRMDATHAYITALSGGSWKVYRYTKSATEGSNIVPNGTFESNLNGWNESGSASLFRSTSVGSGVASMRLTSGGGSQAGAMSNTLSTTSHKRYTLRAIARTGPDATPLTAIIWWMQGSTYLYGASQTKTLPAGGMWVDFDLEAAAPEAATGARIEFRLSNAPSGTSVYVDNVEMRTSSGFNLLDVTSVGSGYGGVSTTSAVYGMVTGSADIPGTAYHVAANSNVLGGQRVRSFNSSGTGVGSAFELPGGVVGFDWDGSNFWSLTSDGNLVKHEPDYVGTGSDVWWAGFTWYDSNATGGTHESDISGLRKFEAKRRARLTVTTPAINHSGGTDDPNSVRIYLGRGATQPARTALWRQSTSTSNTVTIAAPVFTGSNPPAANNFPGAVPATIQSSEGTFYVNGDGTGRWDYIAPPGSVQMYAGETPPAGWIFCNGQGLSTAAYPTLFGVIGYTFGGSGGTFNVPDLRNRFPIGADPKALSATGGSETKDLRHSHGAGSLATGNPTSTYNRDAGSNATASDYHKHDITGSTANALTASEDIMPPWLALNFIIKI